MWLQYVFNNECGMLRKLFEFLHWDYMAKFQWTAPEHLFLAMMIAYGFAGVGFYMLILVARIEGIPADYYEAAKIEGAGAWKQFTKITLPLLKDIIKRCIVLYSGAAAGFFVYSSLFSFNAENATVTPMIYMYEVVFGSNAGTTSTELDVGAGATAGVLIMILILIASPAAYVLARIRFKGKALVNNIFVLGMSIPSVMLVMPLFKMATSLGLIGSRWTLMILYICVNVPFGVFFLSGFFLSLPKALEEAAEIDGCTPSKAFWKTGCSGSSRQCITTRCITASSQHIGTGSARGSKYLTKSGKPCGRWRM